MRLPDGTIQEGLFISGQKNGLWTMHFSNGAVGEGPYVDDEKNGRWTVRLADGRCVVMEWSRGQAAGRSSC